MPEGIFIQWEILIGVGVPLLVAAGGVIRYFMKKEKCFIKMKNKIELLTRT